MASPAYGATSSSTPIRSKAFPSFNCVPGSTPTPWSGRKRDRRPEHYTGLMVVHGGSQAFYALALDEVWLPRESR